jgi:ParB-like chromosome segregation protein Spo0J
LQIKKISIEKLSNDPANARKHDDRNIEAIVGSLRRFGQQKPIVVDVSGVVRAGNGTLEAARRLGWKDIDCVETQLKGSDAIAYAIADNRTAELADWDDDVLAAQLNGLLADDPDLLNAAGFSEEELMKMLDQFNAEEIDPPGLAEGDREPFRQMTFTVHDSQFEVIEAALKAAKAQGGGESVVNENSNGNALAFICNAYTSKGSRS